MNVFERSSDLVAMSAVSDLVNGWPGGIIQAGRHGVFVTRPTCQPALREHLGAERLAAEVEGPSSTPATRAQRSRPRRRGQPVGGWPAGLRQGREHRPSTLAETTIKLSGRRSARRQAEPRPATSPDAFNSFATPDAVAIRRSSIEAGDTTTVSLPPASVVLITLEVQ